MRIFKLCFWSLVGAATLFVGSASAMVVGDAECPSSKPSFWLPPDCYIASYACLRTDGACTVTAAGTPDHALGQTLNCHNCAGCPESQPPAMKCEQSLSVSFTEVVNVSIASGIQAGLPGLQGTLNTSIGHADQRTFSGSATCGTISWPACKKADPAYRVSLSTTTGKATQVVSTYTWETTFAGSGCSGPNPSHDNAGSRTSTANGSEYNGGATCESVNSGVTCVNGE